MSDEAPTELDDDLGLIDDTGVTTETSTAGKSPKVKKSKEAKAAKADKLGNSASVDDEQPTVVPPAPPPAPPTVMPPAPPTAALEDYAVPDHGPGRTTPKWLVPVGMLLAIALVVTTALAVLQWRRANDAESDVDATRAVEIDRQEAATVASQFTTALLTYDFNNLDASRDAVIAVSTKEFADKFGPAFQQGLQPVLTQTQSIATASIRTVYMGDLTENSATAVTIADQTVESNTQSLKKIGSYFKLEMSKVDGTWKVANVTVLGVEDATQTDKDAAGNPITTTTTTTTAPVG